MNELYVLARSMSKRRKGFQHRFDWWWVAGLLLLVTLAAYLPTLSNGFVWDDDDHITKNDTLRSLDGLRRIWLEPGATVQYYPLTFSVWWVCHHLWGSHPSGYHLLNVLLHGLVSILFWRLLDRLEVPGALLAAAVFALHPVHVMSVAWATELKNTLSTSLALGACWTYLRFAEIGPRPNPMASARVAPALSSRWGFYGAALGLFALAMFAKTAVGLLPVTLLLVLWWKKDRLTWGDVAPVVPLAVLALALGRMTAHVERLTGAVGQQFDLDFLQRLVVSGRSFWFYLGKLFLPVDLTFIYPRWSLGDPTPLAYVPAAAVLACLAALWGLRRRLGKGPLVGFLHFYLGTSMLVLFLVLYMTRYSFVSDHWQYLGSLGAIAVLAAAWTSLWQSAGERFSLSGRGLAAAGLIALAVLTWRQCHAYADPATLWRATLAKNPDAWIAHINLGGIFTREGKLDEALSHYVAALASDPFGSDPRVRHAAASLRQSPSDAGIEEVRRAVIDRPYGYEALSGIGIILAMRARYGEALDFFEASVRSNPRYAPGHLNRGLALARLGRLREAIDAFRESIRLDPAEKDAHYQLALALHATGADEEARSEVREFRRLGGSLPGGPSPTER